MKAYNNKINRNREIVSLFVNGHMIQIDIAEKYSVTRERVRQILRCSMSKEEVHDLAKRNWTEKNAKLRASRPIPKCKKCGKEVTNFKTTYCSVCWKLVRHRRTPEEVKESQRKSSKKWVAKNKERVRAHNKVYVATYRQRPEIKEKIALQSKEKYIEMKQNLLEYAKYLADRREYNRIRYAKKELEREGIDLNQQKYEQKQAIN